MGVTGTSPRGDWPVVVCVLSALLGSHFYATWAVPFGPVHIYATDAIVGLLYVVAGYRLVHVRVPFQGRTAKALGIWTVALCFAALIGIADGHEPTSIFNDLKCAYYLGTCFAVNILIRDVTEAVRIVRWCLVAILIAAGYDIWTRLGGASYYPYDPTDSSVILSTGGFSRAYGLITAPPFYGAALALSIGFLVTAPSIRWRLAFGSVAALLAVLLCALLLRGVFIGLILLILSALVLAAAWQPGLALSRFGILALAATSVLALAGLVELPGQGSLLTAMLERYGSVFDPTSSTSSAAATGTQRIDFVFVTWGELVSAGQQILGRGLGYLPVDRLSLAPGLLPFYPTVAYHSFVGWILSKTGALGLALFVGLLASALTDFVNVVRRQATPAGAALTIGSGAALAFLIATSVAENYLLQYAYSVPVVGALLAVPSIASRDIMESKGSRHSITPGGQQIPATARGHAFGSISRA